MKFEPLDAAKFGEFFDIDKRLINEHEFRKSIFKGFLRFQNNYFYKF